MARSVNPVPTHFYLGEPLAYGQMFFFESGTSTPKTTYKDVGETPGLENTHPVILNPDGTEPNIFFSGSAKQRLLTQSIANTPPDSVIQPDFQIWERDPVGAQQGRIPFAEWISTLIYGQGNGNIVTGSDGLYYVSIQFNNQGNDPTDQPSNFWKQIFFNELWANVDTYSIGDRVISLDGSGWKSRTNNNSGNDPLTDGGVNWIPSIDLDRITDTVTQHYYRNR